MKKHQLLEKAMRDYPAGTRFKSAAMKIENESTGIFEISENGGVKMSPYQRGCVIFIAEDDEWATIIPSEKPSLLSGRVAIQVNNEREFKLLMSHMDSKGWKWCSGHTPNSKEPLGDMKFPNTVMYCDDFYHTIIDGTREVSFVDFACEVGIEVPVFVMTSEDGVPLYKGDKFFSAEFDGEKWSYDSFTGDTPYNLIPTSLVVTTPEKHKSFSAKEAALKWIEQANKPKSTSVKLYRGGTAEVYTDHVCLHGGIKLAPSDLEDMLHAYKSLQS